MSGTWYCRIDDGEFGPFSAEHVKRLAANGDLLPTHLVRHGGDGPWSPASRLKGVVFRQPVPPPVTTPKGETTAAAPMQGSLPPRSWSTPPPPPVSPNTIVTSPNTNATTDCPAPPRIVQAIKSIARRNRLTFKDRARMWQVIALSSGVVGTLLLVVYLNIVGRVPTPGPPAKTKQSAAQNLKTIATVDEQVLIQTKKVTKEQVRPSPEVIAAWGKAGAVFGWISEDQEGNVDWQPGWAKPGDEDLPAFRVSVFTTGKLEALPQPEVPFGLELRNPDVTAAELGELTGLKQLKSLSLESTQVTDADLRGLAGLTQLQTLNLGRTEVTDAGLKELAGLTQLQSLKLNSTKVTDASVKELAGLKQLKSLGLGSTLVTDAGLKELAGLTKLQSLNLGNTKVTGVGLKELASMKQLQTLKLGGSKVTDTGLKELAGLTRLQKLDLMSTKVTDAGLKELAGMKQLQTLKLAFTHVTGVSLKELAGLKQLQELNLRGSNVTDAGLKELVGLTQLQSLDLTNTQVTDAGLRQLAGLKQLKSLNLDYTQVTDAGLRGLAGLTQLQTLNLGHTPVTEAGLRQLAGLTQLQSLQLIDTYVTDVGVPALQQALPQVQIVHSESPFRRLSTTPPPPDLPFTLQQLAAVLGEPDERNEREILFSGSFKATKTAFGVDIALSGSRGRLFAAGLFTSQLFTKSESAEIIKFIDDVEEEIEIERNGKERVAGRKGEKEIEIERNGKERVIGRFLVNVGTSRIPLGWRQVRLSAARG